MDGFHAGACPRRRGRVRAFAAAALATSAISGLAAPVATASNPSVSITAPSAGATLSGTVSFTAKASDANGIADVRFKVDGKLIAKDTSSPYGVGWNTKNVSNGSHTLQAVAYDRKGNTTKVTRSIRVANGASSDTTAPTVAFGVPAAGATVSGAIDVTATASDASGVASVRFAVGGTTLSTDTSAPYAHPGWDTAALADGTHRLSLTATDTRGNTRTVTRDVTVANAVILPPPPPSLPADPVPAPPPAEEPPASEPPADPGALPGSPFATADWETGDTSQWRSVQRVATDRIQAVASPASQGDFAGRFEVRQGDVWNGSSGNRAEVTLGTDEGEGDERWYEWSTLFPSGYPSTTSGFQIFTQWHATVGGSQPMVVFFASGDKIGFKTIESSSATNPGPSVTHWTTEMDRGSWHTFRLNVRWSANRSDGWVELWHNGEKVVERTNVAAIIPGYGVYMKQGLYRHADIGPTGVLYHDGLRVTAVD